MKLFESSKHVRLKVLCALSRLQLNIEQLDSASIECSRRDSAGSESRDNTQITYIVDEARCQIQSCEIPNTGTGLHVDTWF